MRRFDDERYYLTTDSELQLLGTPAALAKKRSRGEGPRYLKVGKRVLYRGRDLNQFLDESVIEPTCRRDSSDRSEPGTNSLWAGCRRVRDRSARSWAVGATECRASREHRVRFALK